MYWSPVLVEGWCRYDFSSEADAMVVFIIFIFLVSGVRTKSQFWPPDTNDAADRRVLLDDNCMNGELQPSTNIKQYAMEVLLAVHRHLNAIRWWYHDIIRHNRRWNDLPPKQHNGVYSLQWRSWWNLLRQLPFYIDYGWGSSRCCGETTPFCV